MTQNATVIGPTSLISRDYHAFLKFFNKVHGLGTLISFMMAPGFIAVVLYRFAHYFHAKGFQGVGRAFSLLIFLLTGADIHPATEAGPGLVMLHTLGTILHGKMGGNVTLTSRVYVGPDGSKKDIGAGPGLPVLGDRCFLGGNSSIVGPRLIGSDVIVLASSLVIRDIPSGSKVFGIPARVLGERRGRRKAAAQSSLAVVGA